MFSCFHEFLFINGNSDEILQNQAFHCFFSTVVNRIMKMDREINISVFF